MTSIPSTNAVRRVYVSAIIFAMELFANTKYVILKAFVGLEHASTNLNQTISLVVTGT